MLSVLLCCSCMYAPFLFHVCPIMNFCNVFTSVVERSVKTISWVALFIHTTAYSSWLVPPLVCAISGAFKLQRPAHTKIMLSIVSLHLMLNADFNILYVLILFMARSTCIRTDAMRRVEVTSCSESWPFPEMHDNSVYILALH